jgi:hypothetical protein
VEVDGHDGEKGRISGMRLRAERPHTTLVIPSNTKVCNFCYYNRIIDTG